MQEENNKEKQMEEQNQNKIPEKSILKEKSTENKQKTKKCLAKKIGYIILVIVILLICVQVFVADKYKAQVLVIEGEKKVGVNPTTEKLDFGDLSADTTSTRYITLNAGGMGTYIHVMKLGGIAELIDLNENNFVLEKGDEKKLEFSLYMPVSAPIGQKYTGQVWIFKIPKIW